MFGPVDHYLYMGTGDGGSGGDPPNNAQTLTVLLGKMLRIDVDGTGAVPCGQPTPMPYAIPADNPFVGVAGCDEIWAYGLRNPCRFGFDRSNGDLFIGDVGQGLYEEIDFQRRGEPRRRELRLAIDGGVSLLQPSDELQRRQPDAADPRGDARRRVVRHHRRVSLSRRGHPRAGRDLSLRRQVQGGDLGSDRGRRVWTGQSMLNPSLSISSFGEDEAGEVYVCDLGGAVYRIDRVANPIPAYHSSSRTPWSRATPASR